MYYFTRKIYAIMTILRSDINCVILKKICVKHSQAKKHIISIFSEVAI